MIPYLVGQAPSRLGDGRPFTGPAGRRLLRLLEFDDYQQLVEAFVLRNLLPTPVKRTEGKGDVFDLHQARVNGKRLFHTPRKNNQVVVACGKMVYTAMTDRKAPPWFHGEVMTNSHRVAVRVFAFPHPSGISHFWNDSDNVEYASKWLRAVATGWIPGIQAQPPIAPIAD